MALFKPMYGSNETALNAKNLVEGYCWFTTDDGKFYVDTKNSSGVLSRILLNAGKADQLATARTFQITDNDGTNKGSTVSFNGTSNVIIKLPSTIKASISGNAATATNVAWSGITSKPSYYDAKAIKSITRSGTTFTYTCLDGTTGTFTQQDNNTTYSAGTGISLSGTTFSNSGVRSVTTGTTNGTISVNTNGTSLNVAVKGLQDGAYYPYNNFYNEYYGGTWHQLRMVNSSSDRGSIFYKIADLGRTSGYGTYEAVKITGYMYHHNGNWEQSQTAIIPFQAIVNVSNDTATLYSTRQCSVNWLRLVKVDTRSYELQATCDMAHCDFDIFYQVSNSGSNNCTIYEGQNLVPGTTTGTVLSITNSENWGNYAYKADQLATARTISLTGDVIGSVSFNGSQNVSLTATVADNSHNHSQMVNFTLGTGGTAPYIYNENGKLCARVSPDGSSYNYAWINTDGSIQATKVYGAVWNDYAEFRQGQREYRPGTCVIEVGDDTLVASTERLQGGALIVSDTFGFAIGETDEAKTPIATSGRVLAYTFEPRESYSAGDPVCSGPNGTISKMTEQEVMIYPHKMIGTVSAIPDYEEWGTGKVKVDGRIWIQIR